MLKEKSLQQETGQEASKKSRLGLMAKIKLLLLTIILVLIALGWRYFQQTQVKLEEANRVIGENKILQEEKDRCAGLLKQQSGDFGEYEYCRQLLRAFSTGE